MTKRVLVIGLDCLTPELVFDRWFDDLPNIKSLVDEGVAGWLRSTDPPITVPAWASMMSSKNPGRLGCYGLRNRVDYSYENLKVANATSIKEPRVWDILSAAGKANIIIGVPQTYPPPKPGDAFRGYMVSCFLTPSTESRFTYPPEFKKEVQEVTGGYILDVEGFRTDDKERILQTIYEMTDKRFRLAEHCIDSKPWDFLMMVEMGTDRIHHGLWKYMDPAHPRHEPGNPYLNAIKDYYVYLDGRVGDLLTKVNLDDTTVFVVSDHGARCMMGGFCFNEWLLREGYLTLKRMPDKPSQLEKCEVDWARTKAWGSGGYYARLMINVKGREPQGVVEPSEYEEFRDELVAKLTSLVDHEGKPLGTTVAKPEVVYGTTKPAGYPPDLFVYFGDLAWRSLGTIGLDTLYYFENDTGPDDANHNWHGTFIMRRAGTRDRRWAEGLDIRDVAPTILAEFGLPIPPDFEGKVIS
jgi:predicted AlkP superfamily phosphohydrolase/phosphomutase